MINHTQAKIIQINVLYFYLALLEQVYSLALRPQYEMVSYTFPAVGSQTEEHRGDVPSRADDLSGSTPFTLTGSGSAYMSEYGRNEAATDS